MNRTRLVALSFLAAAAGALVAFQPAQLTVTGVGATVDPAHYKGACPVTVTFNGHITVSRRAVVRYRWMRSDRAELPEQTLLFATPGRKEVAPMTWRRIGRLHYPDDGWAMIRILAPEGRTSNHALTTINCQ
jgi:hypothetical protein